MYYLYYIYILVLLCGLGSGIFLFRKLSLPYRAVTLLLLFTLIGEIAGRVLAYQYDNSSPAYHFLIPLKIILTSFIYSCLLPVRRSIRAVLLYIVTSFFVCLVVMNSKYYQPLSVLPTNAILIESFIVIIYSLVYFYFMFQNPLEIKLSRQPVFWLNSGNLIFYSATFFVWGFYHYFLKSSHVPVLAHLLIWIANVTLYGFYFISLWQDANSRVTDDIPG